MVSTDLKWIRCNICVGGCTPEVKGGMRGSLSRGEGARNSTFHPLSAQSRAWLKSREVLPLSKQRTFNITQRCYRGSQELPRQWSTDADVFSKIQAHIKSRAHSRPRAHMYICTMRARARIYYNHVMQADMMHASLSESAYSAA